MQIDLLIRIKTKVNMDEFRILFEVRDNEIDMQGVVNNSNYFIYLAHCRHKYAHSIGINFAEFAKNNQNLILLATEAVFKQPLLPDDKFYVTCKLVSLNNKMKFAFAQEIRLQDSHQLILKSLNTATCINGNCQDVRKKAYIPEKIIEILNQRSS
jgi:acyl-CoA thioester hydrolase